MRRVSLFSALLAIVFLTIQPVFSNQKIIDSQGKNESIKISREGTGPAETTAILGEISAIISSTSGLVPFTVNITFSKTGDTGSKVIKIDYGDGSVFSYGEDKHTYTKPGTYEIWVTVFEVLVDTDRAEKVEEERERTFLVATVTVEQPFDVDFIQDNIIGNAPLEVQFEDRTSEDPESWFWEFGDGNTSQEQDPLHTYTSEGIYSVALTSTRSDDKEETVTKTDLVEVWEEFHADFSQDETYADKPPLTVSFEDLTTGRPDSWSWDFGDGASSMAQNPSHVYTESGTFTVTLTSSNEYSSDSKTYEKLVIVNNTTGISNQISEMIEVSGFNAIRFNGDFQGDAKIIKYDGRIVMNNRSVNPGEVIDMNGLQQGAYFIVIFDGKNYGVKKVIISD